MNKGDDSTNATWSLEASMHGNSTEMPYDVFETRGNVPKKRGNVSKIVVLSRYRGNMSAVGLMLKCSLVYNALGLGGWARTAKWKTAMLHGNAPGVPSPVPKTFQKRETSGNGWKRGRNVSRK
ncbi:hypothetical protein Tco_0771609 [Tanacetum coccineum]|uniref:Uncharacterized protein n=1 Tax=Tanacetum coccineum TaxID=301880 RepID=A0ABQ4ZJK5_9ASTR